MRPPSPLRPCKWLQFLAQDHEAVARTARGLHAVVEQAKDEPSADLLTQHIAVQNKPLGCCAACLKSELQRPAVPMQALNAAARLHLPQPVGARCRVWAGRGRCTSLAQGQAWADRMRGVQTQPLILSDRHHYPAVKNFASLDMTAPSVSDFMTRELRSDHAGETGAVFIYQGISAVARWRQDDVLLAFAQQHGETEAEHLRLVEACLPPAQRSRLLVPWRIAGWLTGALPALFGRRAVYGTIAAVETFVNVHYQQQIEHLQAQGDPANLLPLLLRCQADEQHHRDEAAALAGARVPWLLRAWCGLVGSGSAAAVVLARRV